ncbi:flagellar hook-basal body complex protein [Burkholderia ubonensis]|uniref:flagellar hook-basal body complex protein n=1 Tax=Burkholderia ubonensis TaxID=101571 RepID=UPI000759F74C|nr:flagellar hook-basal body complex protein [Burkholderia ubonensis]KWB79421.1 flagellar biosynthesis protein FlgE [Burkholderia ubonensis]
MSLDIALSGIDAINSQLDSISNNIANTGTWGFKSGRANFASMYSGMQPNGVYVGSVTQSIDMAGGVVKTGEGLNAAIQGRGFFTVKDTDGSLLYTRVGIFTRDKDGYIIDNLDHRVQGYSGGGGGAFGDMQVKTGDLAAKATDTLDYVGKLSADWKTPTSTPFSKDDPNSYNGSQSSIVYDSLGVKHEVTQYFVQTGTGGNNTIEVHYTMDGKDVTPSAAPTLSFDSNGTLTTKMPITIDFGQPTGAADIKVKINYTGTTYSGGDFSTTTNRADGYASGSLTGVALDEDGTLEATFSNGEKQPIGRLALATFPDDNGLQAVTGTCWKQTNTSGQPIYGVPGAGLSGKLAVQALEQSNVDQTGELVNLTTAQRNYQANSKVISTENQMMQALMQAV